VASLTPALSRREREQDAAQPSVRMKPPRLWAVLMALTLAALAMPLAGLWLLRVYESALVRQTENELVAQAAVLSAAYAAQRGPLGPANADEPPASTVPGPLDIARREPLDLTRDPIWPPAPLPAGSDKAPPLPTRDPAPAAARIGALLDPVLRAAQSVTLAALRITDARGTVVATTGTDLGADLSGLQEVRRAMRGEFVTLLRAREVKASWVPGGVSRGAMLRVHVAMPVIAEGRVLAVVVVSRTPADIAQALWGKRGAVAGLVLAMVVAGVALALAASRLVARPIAAVAAQARRVAAGETRAVQPLARPGTREVAALSAAIAAMAATLERRAVYVRDLAAHVAHEFKTPIAAAAGAAELAGEPDVTPPDRARLLAVVSDALRRLERLTARLLELARADMLAVAPVAMPVLPALEAAARHSGLRVRVRPTAVRVAVTGDVLDGILAALLDNVRAHAGPEASVHMSATAAEGGQVVLRVADDGPGIPAADADRVFDPFFTTARAAGGTGMGLPIVRALATGVGGTVRLAPSERGAVFEVLLPAA